MNDFRCLYGITGLELRGLSDIAVAVGLFSCCAGLVLGAVLAGVHGGDIVLLLPFLFGFLLLLGCITKLARDWRAIIGLMKKECARADAAKEPTE